MKYLQSGERYPVVLVEGEVEDDLKPDLYVTEVSTFNDLCFNLAKPCMYVLRSMDFDVIFGLLIPCK